MNKKLKATLAAASVAVAGLVVLAIYFGGLSLVFQPEPDYTSFPGQARTELMPENSPEFLERHYPGPNGKDLRTEIQYRNGDVGVKKFRADNTLEDWSIEYADGGTRLHAVFAKDGKQVVLGYEFRADRTMKWKAENANGVVTTRTFYYDGTALFSIVQRKIGADTIDASYFRADGKPWLHQVIGLASSSTPELEEVWNAEGQLVYRRIADNAAKTTTVVYFRPDGTAAFKQTWLVETVNYGGEYGWYGYGYDGEGGSYTSTTNTLKNVVEYAEDGSTVKRDLQKTTDGWVAVNGATQTKAEVGDELTKALPTAPNPVKYWEEQEKDPSKRGEAAP